MIKVEPALKKEQIARLIPHKPPFLFVEQINEYSDNKIIGEKTFQKTEAFFKGHYPGNPVVPGVILIETLAQTAAVLTAVNGFSDCKTGYLIKVNEFVFKRVVKPDEKLIMEVILERRIGDNCFFSGKIFCKNEMAAKGQITVKIKDEENYE